MRSNNIDEKAWYEVNGCTREVWFCVALAVVFCSSLQARDVRKIDRPANAATREVHEEAVRIVNSVKLTQYRHRTDIDEKKGAYYCDCSGFVGYVLNRTVAKDDGKGPFRDGRKRPLARDYEKGFAKAPAWTVGKGQWQQIVYLTDARPGDVIAWRHETPKPNNTGHVVIVDQTPIVEQGGLVRVVVIDSTTLPSSDITKEKGKTGIGRRTMWFNVDRDGRAVGYVRGTRTSKPKMEPISVGRALPPSSTALEKQSSGRRAA
jgi:hypothetical protein